MEQQENKPVYNDVIGTNYTLLHGDCLVRLKELPDNSVDSIVTDPPYGLSFMGKAWDKGVPGVDFWKEALRVLKPGGHLLSFSGSRTYHRMASAVEDAGFEIRDQIMWVYGSGFPKSHDVSKAIDKLDAADMRRIRDLDFTAFMRKTGLNVKQINEITQTSMGSHYLTDKEQPAVPVQKYWDMLKPYITIDIPESIELAVKSRTIESENFKKREVVGKVDGTLLAVNPGQDNDRSQTVLNITAPATDAAKKWDGWDTALKPAHEPIVVARKPFKGTVAENVLQHGTVAINIDGCKVGDDVRVNASCLAIGNTSAPVMTQGRETQGRWPANFIHDGSIEQKWARYFYTAKASKSDRNEGLDSFEKKVAGGMSGRADGSLGSITVNQNIHPTVKPTDLMAYLCRLVTPPDGTVLDMFNGSGSTGKAAIREGFKYIGCEMDEEYIKISAARIDHEQTKVDAKKANGGKK